MQEEKRELEADCSLSQHVPQQKNKALLSQDAYNKKELEPRRWESAPVERGALDSLFRLRAKPGLYNIV
jgi:hypothetical protein